MSFHVPHQYRLRSHPILGSTEADGNNGAFFVPGHGGDRDLNLVCSDGLGWEHVSVSVANSPRKVPTWAEMCRVKDLCWDAEDCVVQYHPPRSQYVNQHPGTLHLWRPVFPIALPMPDPIMVGLR